MHNNKRLVIRYKDNRLLEPNNSATVKRCNLLTNSNYFPSLGWSPLQSDYEQGPNCNCFALNFKHLVSLSLSVFFYYYLNIFSCFYQYINNCIYVNELYYQKYTFENMYEKFIEDLYLLCRTKQFCKLQTKSEMTNENFGIHNGL